MEAAGSFDTRGRMIGGSMQGRIEAHGSFHGIYSGKV